MRQKLELAGVTDFEGHRCYWLHGTTNWGKDNNQFYDVTTGLLVGYRFEDDASKATWIGPRWRDAEVDASRGARGGSLHPSAEQGVARFAAGHLVLPVGAHLTAVLAVIIDPGALLDMLETLDKLSDGQQTDTYSVMSS